MSFCPPTRGEPAGPRGDSPGRSYFGSCGVCGGTQVRHWLPNLAEKASKRSPHSWNTPVALHEPLHSLTNSVGSVIVQECLGTWPPENSTETPRLMKERGNARQ